MYKKHGIKHRKKLKKSLKMCEILKQQTKKNYIID